MQRNQNTAGPLLDLKCKFLILPTIIRNILHKHATVIDIEMKKTENNQFSTVKVRSTLKCFRLCMVKLCLRTTKPLLSISSSVLLSRRFFQIFRDPLLRRRAPQVQVTPLRRICSSRIQGNGHSTSLPSFDVQWHIGFCTKKNQWMQDSLIHK